MGFPSGGGVNDTLHYSSDKPTYEMVDLGLPSRLKWAKCNIGAETETDCGKYFQWGDTIGYEGDEAKAHSTWSTAPFNSGSTSYNSAHFASVSGTVCPNGVLAKEYDAATVNMGSQYCLPTKADWEELTANTTNTWYASGNAEFNGVSGCKFTSKSDSTKYIFIPAAGYYGSGSFYGEGTDGYVWSSSLYTSNPCYSWALGFYSGNCYMGNLSRYYGQSLRGVSRISQ